MRRDPGKCWSWECDFSLSALGLDQPRPQEKEAKARIPRRGVDCDRPSGAAGPEEGRERGPAG